ncbi:sodium bicarbonate transporter-like protein 11 isoform X1 [Varroa destructor]|uniref:Bicarbonate transporter-like transmembrane domain-containing protein n=1 Tax=Varroa destructor TaxID=109461 RepID=A0A7M7KV75_VARDE|nr:sodium bicarbonate transporter-like protein 11 isoform X1 [Varroa destructor]
MFPDQNCSTDESNDPDRTAGIQTLVGKTQLLVHKSLRKVPLRDFDSEVRAARDLASEISVIMDIHENSLVIIMELLLNKMLSGNSKLVNFALQGVCFANSGNVISDSLVSVSCDQRDNHFMVFNSSFLCVPCVVPINSRHIGVCRLATPVNFGSTAERVYFIVAAVTPLNTKATKTPLEVLRTFATLLSNPSIRHRLIDEAKTEADFKRILTDLDNFVLFQTSTTDGDFEPPAKSKFYPFRGIIQDLRRRLPHYLSDFTDSVRDQRSIYKTISTTLFLYFSILLPVIAFGTLNNTNTDGRLNVRKTLISQVIGGLYFSLISGQPLVILMTTAPLSLFVKIVHSISQEWKTDFGVMYACVGFFCCAFLALYAVFDVSRITQWYTRSTEEIFSLFITIALFVDAGKDVYHNFQRYYSPCQLNRSSSAYEVSGLGRSSLGVLVEQAGVGGFADSVGPCRREVSLLFIILMLATLWLGLTLSNLTRTPYLSPKLRELLSDYALPLAVIAVSLVGVFIFPELPTNDFRDDNDGWIFTVARIESIDTLPLLISIGLGFALSLLFVMDQNISAAMVETAVHKLKKGTAYDWDILVVAVLNAFLSIVGLPWMHGVLPHSPLHARALSDSEERVVEGYVQHIVMKSRETRVTSLVAHILLGFSILLLPHPLGYIPTAVLDGLFLFMAISSLRSNQFFKRLLLFVTEQRSYPPCHYVRRCTQRSLHVFTCCQLVQLFIFCVIGFSPWPYLTMAFPAIIVAMLAVRQLLIPLIVDRRYLKYLDSKED